MKNVPGDYRHNEGPGKPPDEVYSVRRYSRSDQDEGHFTYGRPTLPSWIAAAAVAFAFFLLGGFIKTYQQLESLREESRREIAELRDAMRRLQVQGQTSVRPPAPRLTPLPPAERRDSRYYDYTRAPYQEPSPVRPPSSPGYVQPAPSGPGTLGIGAGARTLPERGPTLVLPEDADRPRYQIGRSAPDDGSGVLATLAGTACQVVSVSQTHNRIMVEGGRDLGLIEGNRLELVRNGRWIADLRILDVFDNQSACEVLHATLQPQPGDIVRRPPRSQ